MLSSQPAFIHNVFIFLFFVSWCSAWKFLNMESEEDPVSLEVKKNAEEAKRMHSLNAIIHTRYNYAKCKGKQREVYNQTFYKDLDKHRLFYFEVNMPTEPRCVILTVYVPPQAFLKPPRYLIQVCLGLFIMIWKKFVVFKQILEVSLNELITDKMYIIIAVRSGFA